MYEMQGNIGKNLQYSPPGTYSILKEERNVTHCTGFAEHF